MDMDRVSRLVEELKKNPRRFRATDGYERLLAVLRNGYASDAVREVLREDSDVAGDLLWTIAELDDVASFVPEAERHLSSGDKGTAAYAMEVVLRGSQDHGPLLAAFVQLRSCDVGVCEHAVRTLATEGLGRIIEILRIVGGAWGALADELSGNSIRKEIVGGLISEASPDRQVVGLALATLAFEQNERVLDDLMRSPEGWIREYGEWLRIGDN